MSWLVRNEQGETFGPVDLEALQSWACDGRLAPTNEISEDGVEWRIATTNRALEMSWVAEVAPGTFYGPIHKRAMEELVKDGSIAAQSVFFLRCALDEKAGWQAGDESDGRIRQLTDLLEAAKRQSADVQEQLRLAQQQVKTHVSRAELMREQAEACEQQIRQQLEEQTEQAQRRIAAYEEQVRLAQQQVTAYVAQMEQARQQAAAAEAHLRENVRQMASQAEQAHAAYQKECARADRLLGELEAQRVEHAAGVAAAASQERAFAAERQELHVALGQARAEAAARETRLAQLEKALEGAEDVKAEGQELRAELSQARAEAAARETRLAQLEKALEGAEDVKAERQELRAALSQARAETASRETRLAQLEKALEGAEVLKAERQELRAELGQARAEAEARESRLAQFEKALEGAEGADAECGALANQVRVLSSELAGVRQALAGETDAARQSMARCATLEAALEEAKSRRDGGNEITSGEVRAELRQMRQHIESLCVQVRQVQEAREASAVRAETHPQAQPVERVYVEAEPVEVLPPERPKASARQQEAERVAPAKPKKPAAAPPASAKTGRSAQAISMADLEQQARRELERLGAQGANFFKKKK
jgi:chemotaxis protein MotB